MRAVISAGYVNPVAIMRMEGWPWCMREKRNLVLARAGTQSDQMWVGAPCGRHARGPKMKIVGPFSDWSFKKFWFVFGPFRGVLWKASGGHQDEGNIIRALKDTLRHYSFCGKDMARHYAPVAQDTARHDNERRENQKKNKKIGRKCRHGGPSRRPTYSNSHGAVHFDMRRPGQHIFDNVPKPCRHMRHAEAERLRNADG